MRKYFSNSSNFPLVDEIINSSLLIQIFHFFLKSTISVRYRIIKNLLSEKLISSNFSNFPFLSMNKINSLDLEKKKINYRAKRKIEWRAGTFFFPPRQRVPPRWKRQGNLNLGVDNQWNRSWTRHESVPRLERRLPQNGTSAKIAWETFACRSFGHSWSSNFLFPSIVYFALDDNVNTWRDIWKNL